MAEEKVLKGGQITIPRILFLLVVGGLITATVALGGVWLSIGYWLITLSLCVLLYLISVDYGVTMETADYKSQAVTEGPGLSAEAGEPVKTTLGDTKGRRRPVRVAKRRR
ncbi:MAG TPA: hypothetical protein VE262_02480 [Blastocatellia bacterium]|nr:hypothetical protein [Blastocatellia bacterium]